MIRCTTFSIEQIKNIPFGAVSGGNSFERYETAIKLIMVFQKTKEFLKNLAIQDFSVSDMLFPEGKRIKRIFAEISSFMNYRNHEMKNLDVYLEANVSFFHRNE